MNRREALAAASALLGTAVFGSSAFLQGCGRFDGSAGPLTADDVALLDEVGETILPATATSGGARDAQVGRFMDVYVRDCLSPEARSAFMDGLQRLRETARDRYGRTVGDLSVDERHAFVLGLEADAAGAPDHWYPRIKELTVLGYFTSEVGMTQARRFDPVPGRWEPCIPYAAGDRAWA